MVWCSASTVEADLPNLRIQRRELGGAPAWPAQCLAARMARPIQTTDPMADAARLRELLHDFDTAVLMPRPVSAR